MGVPIFDSRKINSSKRVPVPRTLNKVIGRDTPTGEDRIAFWNYHRDLGLPVLTDQPLFDKSEFSYISESKYIAQRKDNGDWDIRPRKGVLENTSTVFEKGDYAFFLLKQEWLEKDPKGVYILSSDCLHEYLPVFQNLKNYSGVLKNSSTFDTKRAQEMGGGNKPHIGSLFQILENAGITDLKDVVNQIYTTGRVDTNLDLPPPHR